MRKLFMLLIVFMMSMLVACGGNSTETDDSKQELEKEQTETQEGSFPKTITDAVGEEVVIENKPERIISVIPSNTEIVFELGLGDKVVGVTDNDNYPEEVEDIEKVGGMELNVEKVLSLEPDIVLAQESIMGMAEEGLQQIRNADIPVLVVNDATNFDSVYESIEMIGLATGTEEKAEVLITEMQNEIKAVQEKAQEVDEKKTVLFEVFPEPDIYVGGKNTFMDEILTIINAENVVEEEGWPQLDEEAIIAYNPDIIITTYGFYVDNAVEQVMTRSGWSDVTAIKDEQVYDVHSDKVTRPGPRLVEGVKEIAEAVYPEVFNE